jgi:chloramphenicol 3-O-phosphotransferase
MLLGLGDSDSMELESSVDATDPPLLLSALLEGRPAQAADAPVVARQLAVIRAGSPMLLWFGINERRVDAVVSAGGEEYRIVYFSADGRTIDALSVFRRPPRFDGIAGGRVVVVNGPSGAGKSSLLGALAEQSSLPWVLFDEPVVGHVEQTYLIWRDQAPLLHRGFLDAIAAVARRGNLVALSAAGHPAAVIDDAFHDVRVLRVGLDCDTATLLARERGREGRWGGLVAASLADHDGWSYDVRFDSASRPAAEIATEVLRRLSLPV